MSLLCVPWKWTSIKKKAETPLDDDQLIKTYLENGEWWNPLDFQGVWVLKERGKTCQERKSGRHSLPIFLPWKKSTARCNNFKDPGVQVGLGGGKTSSSSTTGLGLAPFGSWCLFGAMKKTGRRFLLNFFASEKKHIWTWVSFFQAGYFLGFLVGIGKGFTLEMLFQDAFFSSRIFIDTFCRRNQLHFWILKFWWEEDFTRKLGKEMYIPVKSTKYMYIYIYR